MCSVCDSGNVLADNSNNLESDENIDILIANEEKVENPLEKSDEIDSLDILDEENQELRQLDIEISLIDNP